MCNVDEAADAEHRRAARDWLGAGDALADAVRAVLAVDRLLRSENLSRCAETTLRLERARLSGRSMRAATVVGRLHLAAFGRARRR